MAFRFSRLQPRGVEDRGRRLKEPAVLDSTCLIDLDQIRRLELLLLNKRTAPSQIGSDTFARRRV